jgi:hypothetical protein
MLSVTGRDDLKPLAREVKAKLAKAIDACG